MSPTHNPAAQESIKYVEPLHLKTVDQTLKQPLINTNKHESLKMAFSSFATDYADEHRI